MAIRESSAVTTAEPWLENLLGDWDGEEMVQRFDPETGAWMFIPSRDRLTPGRSEEPPRVDLPSVEAGPAP